MTLREQLEQRRQQWEAFNVWEREQAAVEREPADLLADLGTVWNWLPAEVQTRDPDPGKQGVQAMRAALSRLKPSS